MKKPKKVIEKRFIVRKYIMAVSASDALKKEIKHKADECWVDEKWIEQANKDNAPAIGFSVERDNEDDW